MRQQSQSPTLPPDRQARDHIPQIRIRVMPVQPGRLDQANDRGRTLLTAQQAREQLVRASIAGSGCPPGCWHFVVVEVAHEGFAAQQAVVDSPHSAAAAGHVLALHQQPAMWSVCWPGVSHVAGDAHPVNPPRQAPQPRLTNISTE